MTNLIAEDIQIAPSGGFKGFGPLGNVTSKSGAFLSLSGFISTTIGVMTIIAFVWFVFTFFVGIISMIGAGGDKQAMETAKKKVTTGILGLVITVAAIFLIDVVGKILGVDILDLPTLLSMITK